MPPSRKEPATVIVMGGGVGGLSAAIHARLHGCEVLLVEQDRVGGKAAGIELDGFRLDPGPSIVILARIYEELFQRTGRKMEEYLQFVRLDPISRVFFEPDVGFIDLPADRRECEALVDRIDRKDGKAFKQLLCRLDEAAPHIDQSVFKSPISKPWQLLNSHLIQAAMKFDARQSYKQYIDRLFRSPLLRAFFYGFPSYGGQGYDGKAMGSLLIPYFMIEEGVFYPVGGVAAIPAALKKLASEVGVEVCEGVRVQELKAKHGRLTEVISQSGERFKADAYISNIDRTTTREMLGYPSKERPSFSYFTVHWGVRREMPQLSHHTLLIPSSFETGFKKLYREKRMPEEPIVYLNVTSSLDPSTAPMGCTNLFAVVSAPAMEDHLDWDEMATGEKAKVQKLLSKFGFGFDAAEQVFERIQTPAYFQRAHGNYRGSLYGPDERDRPMSGMFPPFCHDPDNSNLFYCGGSVQPGAGLPMVTLSGMFAADLADNYLRRSGVSS